MLAACTVPDPAANVPRGKPFLWEATGRGTIHLFGEYWRECPENIPRDAVQQMAGARTFVTLTHEGSARGFIWLPSPTTLLDYLSFDQVKELEYRFASGNSSYVTPDRGDRVRFLRPYIFLKAIAHVRSCASSAGTDPFFDSAKHTGAKHAYLEEPEALSLLIDDAADAKALSRAMSDDGWAKREYMRTITAYRAGDETALLEPDDSLAAALRGRHAAWAARLLTLAQEGSVSVEVPVGDLVGPEGLIAELKKLGYEVRRI
jgi:uncharacterized protein YbaP (TraB family)